MKMGRSNVRYHHVLAVVLTGGLWMAMFALHGSGNWEMDHKMIRRSLMEVADSVEPYATSGGTLPKDAQPQERPQPPQTEVTNRDSSMEDIKKKRASFYGSTKSMQREAWRQEEEEGAEGQPQDAVGGTKLTGGTQPRRDSSLQAVSLQAEASPHDSTQLPSVHVESSTTLPAENGQPISLQINNIEPHAVKEAERPAEKVDLQIRTQVPLLVKSSSPTQTEPLLDAKSFHDGALQLESGGQSNTIEQGDVHGREPSTKRTGNTRSEDQAVVVETTDKLTPFQPTAPLTSSGGSLWQTDRTQSISFQQHSSTQDLPVLQLRKSNGKKFIPERSQQESPPVVQEVPEIQTMTAESAAEARIRSRSQSSLETPAVQVVTTTTECQVPNTVEVAIQNPSWTASYPGSGAKLTWKLVRAITGAFTGDDHDHNGRVKRGVVVTVKTHFPAHTPPEVMDKPQLEILRRAILLVRNPLSAIPSFHNFIYEQENGLRNHSTRAPIEVWIKWRNEQFEAEIQRWVDHIKYWVDRCPPQVQGKIHLLPFEDLVSDEKGVETLGALANFLAGGGEDIASRISPKDQFPCIWDLFVKGNVPGEKARRHSHRSGGPSSYPYTEDQLHFALLSLRNLQQEQGNNFPALSTLLGRYIQDMEERKTSLDNLVQ